MRSLLLALSVDYIDINVVAAVVAVVIVAAVYVGVVAAVDAGSLFEIKSCDNHFKCDDQKS